MKIIYLILLIALPHLHAQNTGSEAIETVKIAASNEWPNWVFAGSALLTATGAILAVSLQNGEKVQNTSH